MPTYVWRRNITSIFCPCWSAVFDNWRPMTSIWIWIMWIYYVEPTAFLVLWLPWPWLYWGSSACCNPFFFLWVVAFTPNLNFIRNDTDFQRSTPSLSNFQNFHLQTPARMSRAYQRHCTFRLRFSHPWATASYCAWTGKRHVYLYLPRFNFVLVLHSPLFACIFRPFRVRAEPQCDSCQVVEAFPLSLVNTDEQPFLQLVRERNCLCQVSSSRSWCGIFDGLATETIHLGDIW